MMKYGRVTQLAVTSVKMRHPAKWRREANRHSQVLLNQTASYSDCSVKHDVAIIGAGICGAYSAYKLRNENLNIGLYEYSDRIGGRFYTDHYPEAPDQNLELGGMRLINNAHILLQTLINDLGLKQVVLQGEDFNPYGHRTFLRNVSLTTEELRAGDIPYDLTAEEKANQADLLMYMFRKLTNDPLDNVTEHNLFDLTLPDGRKLYELSAPEALSLVASPEAQAYLLHSGHYSSDHISAVDMLYYSVGPHELCHDYRTVPGGFSQIVKSAVQRFLEVSTRHSTQVNRKLVSIEGVPGNYTLKFRRTVTTDGETRELEGRPSETSVCTERVILALPKYGLTQVNWAPLRSNHYKSLLDGTFMSHASKVFLTYKSPWWLHDTKYPTKSLFVPSLGEIYDWGQSDATGHWTLLASFATQVHVDSQWAASRGLSKSLIADANGGQVDPGQISTVMEEPDKIPPGIRGSVRGANRVTTPHKDYLYNELAPAFGISRSDIPDPVSSAAQFWTQYPYGGAWAFTRPGYRYSELILGYRWPSKTDSIFVVGSDFACKDTIGWAEGGLSTVEKVTKDFFGVESVELPDVLEYKI